MDMCINAVIDTNVLVSASYTQNIDSPTVKIIDNILVENIIPIYNKYIIKEYVDILYREKFNIDEDRIIDLMHIIVEVGCEVNPKMSNVKMIDETDRKFYDAYCMTKNCYLVTGNIKYYPKEKNIVTPRDIMEIVNINYEK